MEALRGIDIVTHRREFLCVVGPSGCGKSTFVRILAGLEDATSGVVLVDGMPVDGPCADLGMVFQGYTLFPWLTVLKNVMFGLRRRGESRRIAEREAREWLSLIGLDKFADAYPHQLSGGMKQRVAIARALAVRPRILLMDEPFSALDAQARARMQAYLLEIWRKIDVTIVFITHDLDEAVLLARSHPRACRQPRPGRRADRSAGAASTQYLASLRPDVPRDKVTAGRTDPPSGGGVRRGQSRHSPCCVRGRGRMTSNARKPLLWADRTWEELPADLARAAHAAMLPVGATEQHGPHLGCGMDFVLAERLCRDVSGATGVPVLPTLTYGCSLGHSRRWPGTIALDPLVMTQLVTQIGTWAHHSGVQRLFLVNAHVTNSAPLRCALEMLRAAHDDLMVALVDTAAMSGRVRAAFSADAADWHANEAETALMMSLRRTWCGRIGSPEPMTRIALVAASLPIGQSNEPQWRHWLPFQGYPGTR